MNLSCYCSDGDGDWWWRDTSNWKPLNTVRARLCCSCKAKINPGETTMEFYRYRGPRTDIEERIVGDEVSMASWWMCEPCSDMFVTLEDLGFCLSLGENMHHLVSEYNEMRKNGYI